MTDNSKKYILTLDEGTTSTRAIVWNSNGEQCGIGQHPFTQFYPHPGWVEHDPEEIWQAQKKAMDDAISTAGLDYDSIGSIGITNQRETTVVWNKTTGVPVSNAIVWQDRRTSSFIDTLKENYDLIKDKTGLIPDPYFSASKIKWILDNIPNAKELANKGDLKFGTIDSWLLWKLTNGKIHCTDYTNASRTMLFDINKLQWNDELLNIFNIPESMLPEVMPSSFNYGYTDESITKIRIPVASMIGDQQSSLVGQLAFSPGQVKNTYGTGSFVVVNVGNKPVKSKDLVTTIGYSFEKNKVTYALEGSIFVTGAAVQWLRDGLKLFEVSGEIESLARNVNDNDDVYFVPALTGLGAPYWDPYARGLIIGITRGTTQAHIARSTLESIAYQTNDIFRVIKDEKNLDVTELRVDGGATQNDFLMQFQADISNINVIRPQNLETTARGAAFMAGVATDIWKISDLSNLWKVDKTFYPYMDDDKRNKLYNKWKKAVERARGWAKD